MRRSCPDWFQDRLTRVGGTNPYGNPIFKLVWGESETMRDGGYFLRDGYLGYRDIPAIGGEKCWALMMWEPPSEFGTPWRWYRENTDENTGLVTLGQYPYHGRYRILKKFIHRELVGQKKVKYVETFRGQRYVRYRSEGGHWETYRMEPTHFILDVMVPLIIEWDKLSNLKRLQVIREEQARDEAEADRILADSRSAHRISRSSPMVQKRMELMEKHMAKAMEIASRTQRGMRQIGA